MYVAWMVHVWRVTRSCVWRDSFISVAWILYVCKENSCSWRGFFTSVVWLVHTSAASCWGVWWYISQLATKCSGAWWMLQRLAWVLFTHIEFSLHKYTCICIFVDTPVYVYLYLSMWRVMDVLRIHLKSRKPKKTRPLQRNRCESNWGPLANLHNFFF